MSRPAVLGVLGCRAATVFQAAKAAMLRRRTRGDLRQMNDRMLRDIGLTRQDLWSVTAEPLSRGLATSLATSAGCSRMPPGPEVRERAARVTLQRLWNSESRTAR